VLDLRTAPLPDGDGPRAAAREWAASRIAERLGPFDPVLVASLASGLQADQDSDVDVVCDTRAGGFVPAVRAAYGARAGFALWTSDGRTVVSFEGDARRVELSAEPRAVEDQRAYRHAVAHRRLVLAGGAAFAAEVRERRRRDGLKTEPALAAVLALEGDPFDAVEALATADDAELAVLLARRARP
jgi:hypothetical protein